jgi:hypothetical protein|tara:strand:+ start:223 stop:645 length:423 start_codon:yes stop_codon:yes gene_type:complete
MILISHRGNLNGKSNMENRPGYIHKALGQDFDVEIDVWWFGDGGYWLGHDKPQYHVDENFLENPRLWCHAKNIDALYKMNINSLIHCFWHQEDDVTLTSRGYLWTYPGKQLTSKSIAVLPEGKIPDDIAGVCSDYIGEWL